MSVAGFHPAVQRWFETRFREPTEPQRRAWPLIQEGRDVLIAAPTGSGKTFAAFLSAIDGLVRQGLEGEGTLRDETQVVYVSPLKALSNDVQKNLSEPLAEIGRTLGELGLPEVAIRTLVRTGDTPPAERQAMVKRPPHILVTTPESLYLILTSERAREMLRSVRTVIVDEIHAVARDKRGSHLALSLERLEALAGRRLQRVGLSATQKPIEEIGAFLTGTRHPAPGLSIIDAGHARALDLAIEIPSSPLEAVMAGEVWDEVYERLAQLIAEHRTTLVFVNTRKLCERLAMHLSERLGAEHVTSHHGSLSKDKRLEAESRLKAGQLKCLVATASLELGIDIGTVDLVCQIASTRAIATLLQRVGRSGHHLQAVPKGRLFPLSRDDLVECTALLRAVREGRLDRLLIPAKPLDILAQQIVAAVACEESGEVGVVDAKGQPPSIPFWLGEAPARTDELSEEVSRLREELEAKVGDAAAAIRWLGDAAGLAEPAARQIVEYLGATKQALGVIPSQQVLVLERFFDEAGGMQLVVHAPFGARINKAWGLALRKRFCRSFNFELQAAATDDAIVLSLGPHHSFPLDEVFHYVGTATVAHLLVQAMLVAPMFQSRWRWNATRALAVLRSRGGRQVPTPLQRMEAEDLVAAVFPDQLACPENLVGDRDIPDHPLVTQTIHDCLTEAMDLPGLTRLLGELEAGKLTLIARDTTEPSPLSHEILTAKPYAFLDDAPLEERRTQAVITRRALDHKTADEFGTLDQSAIDRVREEAWPEAGNAEELHDALLVTGGIADFGLRIAEWGEHFEALVRDGRATVLEGPVSLWVATERVPMLSAVYPGAAFEPEVTVPERERVRAWSREDAIRELVRGRLEVIGPTTVAELARTFALESTDIDFALGALEHEGFVLRGRFTAGCQDLEWCERRLLARIHRYTLDRLRKEIEPVAPADFLRFLLRWQRVSEGTRAEGPEGLAAVLDLLDGFEIAAGAWEVVTSDGFAGLRALLVPSERRRPIGGYPRRRGRIAPFGVETAGRWARIEKRSLLPDDQLAEALAWQLLRRYGVVFRRLVQRESLLLPWRDVLRVLRRLEARGEVRGGRFMGGFSGEQYALPEAVGMLRAVRREASAGELVAVSGADPLNLVGIITAGELVPAVATNRVLYRDGIAVAVQEGSGKGERYLTDITSDEQRLLKAALVRRRAAPLVRAYLGKR